MTETITGILGGLGPSATASLFQKIINATSVEKDQDHFRVIIDSNPKIPDRTKAILQGGENPVPMMVETARTIEQAGADLIVIPCVTAHYFYNQIQDHVKIPIVNVFDVLTHFLQQHYPDVQTVGVLCTTGTKTTNLFGKKLTDYEIVYPDNQSQEQEVMAAIYGEEGIKQGNMGEYPRVLLKSAAEKLAAKGCDILICGCTEVELALKQEDVGRPLIDPMDVMAGYVTHNR